MYKFNNTKYEIISKHLLKKWFLIFTNFLKSSGLNPRGEMNLSPH